MPLTHIHDEQLEQFQNHYLGLAQSLTPEQWQGEVYVALDDVLDLLHENNVDEARTVLQEIELHLHDVYSDYLRCYLAAPSLSSVSLLAHRRLQEAVEHLYHALTLVVGANSLAEAEAALKPAEWGCRLLVVVGHLASVQQQAGQEAA